jgi:hypothetical protein
MILIAFAIALLALAVSTLAATDGRGRNYSPALFALLVGSLLVAYLGSAHDQALATASAAAAAAMAAAGLCLGILRLDSRLAAEEVGAFLGMPPGRTVYSFSRSGRQSLLVFVHLDRLGRVLEASAFDPED